MGLRDEQREATRRLVLGAVLDLVSEGSLDELSVPAVARRSGVSLATIYRYFPSKDDLLTAAAAEPSRRALASEPPPSSSDGDELASFQRAMWHDFAHNLPLLRYQITSAAGRAMREARLEQSRRQLAAYVSRRGIDPGSAAGQRLISLMLLISGSLALVELHDRQGVDVDEALDHSIWAVRALVDATRRDDARRNDMPDREDQR